MIAQRKDPRLAAATLSTQSAAEATMSLAPASDAKPVVGAPIPLTAQPQMTEITDSMGTVHRVGRLGIGRSGVEFRPDPAVALKFGYWYALFLAVPAAGFLVPKRTFTPTTTSTPSSDCSRKAAGIAVV